MKKYLAAAISILLPLSVAASARAQVVQSHDAHDENTAQLIAQFGGIRIPGGGDDVDEIE